MKTFSVFGDVQQQTVKEGIRIKCKIGKPIIQLGGGNSPRKSIFIGYKDYPLIVSKDKKIYHGEILNREGMNIIVFPREFTDKKVLVRWEVVGELNGDVEIIPDKKVNIISTAKYKVFSKWGDYFMYRQDTLVELEKGQCILCKRTPGVNPDSSKSQLNILGYDGNGIITKYIQ